MARAYSSYRRSGYVYECRTELTEVLCTGIDVVQNSQKFRVRVIPGHIHALGGGVRLEVEDLIQLAWCVHTGQTSSSKSVTAVWALSMITTAAINREPQQLATRATAALTATNRGTAYPGGGA